MHDAFILLSWLLWILHPTIVFALAIRVIMRRPATGVALAWLLLIALTPFLGPLFYLLVGERRIERSRGSRLKTFRADAQQLAVQGRLAQMTHIDWTAQPPIAVAMDKLGTRLGGIPTVQGNHFQLFAQTQKILQEISTDIDKAQKSVLMEFYIWNAGGEADRVVEALCRAAQRGVRCYVLVDALGARPWWKSDQPRRLRAAGVQLRAALPTGLGRAVLGRNDLRLHRKIVVLDGSTAWTGSMNLVDPRFFKQDSGVGQWVDAMVRLEGFVAAPLALTMLGDWLLETKQPLADLVCETELQIPPPRGTAAIQVVPSGPGESGDAQLQMMLALIHGATREILMTTPYFVPDDALLCAVRGAVSRGVNVKLIVPEKVDSFLTRHASRSYFDELLECGVEIYLYRQGLLHTKSISVDGDVAMFGTVNLDMRSLWLNYEVALYIYDQPLVTQLVHLQQSYIADATRLTQEQWNQRRYVHRFLENTLRLASPLL